MKKQLENIKTLLSNKKRITLFLHLNPDGDSVGSTLALQSILTKNGHECTVVSSDFINNTIHWLPGAENILIAKRNLKKVIDVIKNTELFICADFNQLSRIGTIDKYVLENPAPRILIDHHLNPNKKEFDIIISDTKVSSTSELLYNFFKKMQWINLIDQDIATNLYVGIITDTGVLSYSCFHVAVYKTIAYLMKYNIDIEKVRARVYASYGESHHRILGYALKKMKIIPELRSAYIVLTKKELKELNYHIGDTEGLANICISLKDIVFGCLIIEREVGVRLSLRSLGDFDVNKLACQYFKGGGHKNASGGDSDVSPDETGVILEKILHKHKKELLAVVL